MSGVLKACGGGGGARREALVVGRQKASLALVGLFELLNGDELGLALRHRAAPCVVRGRRGKGRRSVA